MLSRTARIADRTDACRSVDRNPTASVAAEARGPGLALLLSLCLMTAACAAATAVHRGRDAEMRQDYDAAVVEYTKALRLHPDDPETRMSLERAKLRAADDHFQKGRRSAATGKYDQALIEYELAGELNPTSSEIDQALRSTRN